MSFFLCCIVTSDNDYDFTVKYATRTSTAILKHIGESTHTDSVIASFLKVARERRHEQTLMGQPRQLDALAASSTHELFPHFRRADHGVTTTQRKGLYYCVYIVR